MGYINIKLTSIEIPNSFRILYKSDDGSNSPYPISGGSWMDYGLLVGQPSGIYAGGTTEIMLSGQTIDCGSCPDFGYGTMYWIKLEEVDYPERYVIKNIKINSSIAYPFAPTPTPSISVSASATPTITPTPTPTPDITTTPSVTITPTVTITRSPIIPTPTPTITPTGGDIVITVNNNVGDENSIVDVTINGTSISSSMSPAFPYYPGDNGVGLSPHGAGTYSVAIYLNGINSTDKFIMLYDSFGNPHCINILAGTTPMWITFTNIPITTAGIVISLYNSGLCPEASPSQTPSITISPSITPTPSPSIPNTFKYYADIFNCVFPLCEGYVGSTVIENSYVLTPGKYYLDSSYQVFYILSTSSEEITVLTNMGGSGYDNCNTACATA